MVCYWKKCLSHFVNLKTSLFIRVKKRRKKVFSSEEIKIVVGWKPIAHTHVSSGPSITILKRFSHLTLEALFPTIVVSNVFH